MRQKLLDFINLGNIRIINFQSNVSQIYISIFQLSRIPIFNMILYVLAKLGLIQTYPTKMLK